MQESLNNDEWMIICNIHRKPNYRFYGEEAVLARTMWLRGFLKAKTYGEYEVTPVGDLLYHQKISDLEKKSNVNIEAKTIVERIERRPVGDDLEIYGPAQRMVHSRKKYHIHK